MDPAQGRCASRGDGGSPAAVRSTVVVVTWRGCAHVAACLAAVAAQDRPHRTLVVDNASDDGTADVLACHPSNPEILRTPRNLGYAGGVAAAIEQVTTPFVAWLNDDAAPEPGWLSALEDALDADAGVWAAASALHDPSGEVQSLGVRLTADGHGADIVPGCEQQVPRAGSAPARPEATPFEVFGFCGGAALLRTEPLRAVGGVPAGFFCYYEDTDTSWRIRLAGARIVSVPAARAAHLHGASTRPGSPRFHRWNERNRLLALLRCAPARVAARELARFAGVTLALPYRALRRPPANFRVALRLRVLAEVCAGAPAALRTRAATAESARRAVWTRWAGR